MLAAFGPTRIFEWLRQYFKYRIGRCHPFRVYAPSDPDQGVYTLDNDGEIRIAMAGDWATGTDEAECVAKLMEAFEPHYSIHLGDVYYVVAQYETDENFLGIKVQTMTTTHAVGQKDRAAPSP